jgi:MoaA/NifB/PqqE/SkfB family radical SAM enzyme
LWRAGLDQFGISLDFLDERHDRARGIPRLAARIQEVAPRMADAGVDHLLIQTVIKSDNLDCVLDVVHWAISNGLKSSLSAYTPVKADNHDHDVTPAQLAKLRAVIDELIQLKAETGAIASSTSYLRRIPEYFASGGVGGCQAGRTFLTVSPAGEIQRCSESPVECRWQDFRPGRFGATGCRACFTSCRGECEAPLDWERIVQAARACRPRATRPLLPASRPLAPADERLV